MCAGKDHAKDKLHQPIAAAHAAAFAFSILSFRSKVPGPDGPMVDGETKERTVDHAPAEGETDSEERRIDFIFNFERSRDDWSEERVETNNECLKKAIGDENLTLMRIDVGVVRVVLNRWRVV